MKKTGLRICAFFCALLFVIPMVSFSAPAAENGGYADMPKYIAEMEEGENAFLRIPFVGSYKAASGKDKESCTGNCNEGLTFSHVAYEKNETLIIEADYRPHSNRVSTASADVFFSSYTFAAANGDRMKGDGGELSLCRIDLHNGAIDPGLGGKTVAGVSGLMLDQWNRVQIVYFTSNGNYDIYVNGVLYAYQHVPKLSAEVDGVAKAYYNVKDVRIGKDSLVVARCSKTSTYTESDLGANTNYIDVDNVSIRTTNQISVTVDGEKKCVATDIGLNLTRGDKKLLYAEIKNPNEPMFYTSDTQVTGLCDGAVIQTSYVGLDSVNGVDGIRTEAPYGLRFLTAISKADYERLTEDVKVKRIRIGTVILPLEYIKEDVVTAEYLSGLKHVDVAVAPDEWYDHEVQYSHVFAGTIINLQEKNYNTPFVGIGYVSLVMRDGSVVTAYAENQKKNMSPSTLSTLAYEELLMNKDLDAKTKEEFEKYAENVVLATGLEGLNVLAIGDSLFQGARNEDGYNQWINMLGRQYNWNLTNLGIGGATISYQPQKNLPNVSMYDLLFNHPEKFCYGSRANPIYYNVGSPSGIKSDVDIILLQSGSNDYGKTAQAPLGTLESDSPETFLGAWKLVVNRLLEEYPNATVVMMTAWYNSNQTREDNAQAIPYTSSVVDLYEAVYAQNDRVMLIDSGDPEVSNVHMQDSAWRAQYSFDSFHLNDEGMLLMANSMVPYLEKVVQKREELKKAAMKELNVLAIGDSLFGGHTLADGEQWLELLAKEYDWNLTNLGANGWTVAYNPGAYADQSQIRPSMYNKLMTDANYKFGTTASGFYNYGSPSGKASDVDVVFLEGGWNDYGWNIPLGKASDTDGSTYMGAINSMVRTLLETYPNAHVILITSWHTGGTRADGAKRMDFISDGMKEVLSTNYANNPRVSLIDAGDPEVSGIRTGDSAWAAEYAMDAAHLNAKGMKVMAENMPDLIREVLSK